MKTKPIKDAKNKKMLICMFIFFGIFVFIQSTFAATYYVDGLASDDTGDGSQAHPKKYIQSGISLMIGGDTLIIRDGIYTGSSNMINNNIPSGTAAKYTVVKAETDFGVIIDAEVVAKRIPLHLSSSNNYIEIHGIEFRRPGDMDQEQASSPVFINSSHHVKLFRVGAFECAQQAGDTQWGDMSNTLILFRTSYVLLEECYAWGWGKYVLALYETDHTVIRRCVVRQDGWAGGVGDVFTNYSSTYTEYQNNVAIDMDEPRHWHPDGPDALWGGFNINGSSSNIAYRGNIAINISGTNGIIVKDFFGSTHSANYNPGFRLGPTGNTTFMENNMVVASVAGVMTYDQVPINNSTFVNITEDSNPQNFEWEGLGVVRITGTQPVATNSLFVNIPHNAVSGVSLQSDYNVFYGNGLNYDGGSIPGAHDKSSQSGNEINPIWSISNPNGGLKYPTRIETGSNISGIGKDGANIGANIMQRYGVSGSLWGDPDFNKLGADPRSLWPFPNEGIIRERMRVYNRWDPYDNIDPNNPSNPETYVKGDRGFCADGKQLNGVDDITLTSYIWEYLGNPIPPEIYGSSGIAGDLNSDGKVDITDVQACVNHILGAQDWGGAADVNSDGAVNILDVQAIVNIILSE